MTFNNIIKYTLSSVLVCCAACSDDFSYVEENDFQVGDSPLYLYASESMSFGAYGGSEQMSVYSNNQWSLSSLPSWLTADQTSGGTNEYRDTYITFTAEPNTDADTRIGIFSIDVINSCWNYSQDITATQYAAAPYATLAKSSLPPLDSFEFTYDVAVETNCSALSFKRSTYYSDYLPNINDNADWIKSVYYNASASTISFTVEANNTDGSRLAHIYILNEEGSQILDHLSFEQKNSYAYTESKELEIGPDGGVLAVNVVSDTDWSLHSPNSWISTEPMGGHSGTTKVSVNVDATDTKARQGNIYLSKDSDPYKTCSSIVVYQNARAITYNTDPSTIASDGNSSISFSFEANGKWEVTDYPSWTRISPTSGEKGSNTITITADENTAIAERSGNISLGYSGIAIKSFTIKQDGKASGPTETELNCNWKPSTIPLSIVSPTRWNATVSAGWITLSKYTGVGDETVTVSITKNNDEAVRKGTITVMYADGAMSKDVTVTQTGQYLTLSEESGKFSQKGGAISLTASTDFNIEYEIEYPEGIPADWLTCQISRAEIPVRISATQNMSGYERTATFRLKAVDDDANQEYRTGIIIPITQMGRTLEASVAKVSSYSTGGTSETCEIYADGNFSIAQSNDSWFQLVTIDNTFYVIFQENNTGEKREGSITITLLDTPEGENFTLSIPVIQYNKDVNFDRDNFGEDEDWTITL